MSQFLFHSLDETNGEIIIAQSTIVQGIKGEIINCTKDKGKTKKRDCEKNKGKNIIVHNGY